MSLALTLSNALSGLQVNQAALQVTANNVANVNTEGYSRKTVETSSRVLGGLGAGAEITAITRAVNQFLTRDVRTESSALGERQVRADYYTRMQQLFGNLGDNTSIGATINDLATAMEDVATNPESAAHRINAVNAGVEAARSLNDLATNIQEMRGQADQEIEAAVDLINTQLEIIAELNVKISNNRVQGLGTADLEDQRDLAVNTVAEHMSIQYFERANGHLVVLTKNGQTLVETQAATLGYSQTTVMTPEQRYLPPSHPDYPGGLSGIILNPTPGASPASEGARDLTGSLGAGRLSGLLEMRDRTLSDLGSQFDELAARLRDEINAIHNQGVGYPGSPTLSGTTKLPQGGATTIEGTGIVRIGLTDADGNMAPGYLDLDLSTVNTAADVVAAINGIAGMSASLDAAGRLTVSSTTPGMNVVIADDAAAPSEIAVGGGSRGFSHFLGLNDFFSQSTNYNSFTGDIVSPSIRSTTSGTLTIQTGTGSFNVAYTNGMRLDQVAQAINDGLSGQNVHAEVRQVTGGARLVITGPAGQDIMVTDSVPSGGLLDTLNMRPSIIGAAEDLAVRADIVDSPDKLSRGVLLGNATDGYYVSSADAEIARDLAAVFSDKLSFSGVGGLSAVDATLADFGASILSFNATNAAAAQTELSYQETLHRNLKDKALSFSGVNMDEELSNMVVYQNAYQASARLVQAASDMFDVLVNLGR